MKQITYVTKGVCSKQIEITIDNDIITAIRFVGGCAGNTQGVAALAIGRLVDEVIDRLSGIRCGFKSTSCPDQLSAALRQYKENQ